MQQWPLSDNMSEWSYISSSPDPDQALAIKRTTEISYPCYSDGENGVMALNDDELVYVDWVWRQDGSGRHKIRIVRPKVINSDNEGTNGCFRSIITPNEFDKMRFVDMDYASHLSRYIMALVERISPYERSAMARNSLIYLFDSKNEAFEQWLPFCKISQGMGLITRMCYCSRPSLTYLIVNTFGQSDLVILNANSSVQDRKPSNDLPLTISDARLVDIACTPNNDLIALGFNTASAQSRGHMGVCLVKPKSWIRMSSIDLYQTNIPFRVPRLAWINRQALFALLNQYGDIIVFDTNGKTLGTRKFKNSDENYGRHPAPCHPSNLCVQSHWIAIRYTRFITIHRVCD